MPEVPAPQVVVRGRSRLSVEPETATVHVSVSTTARDRQTALERCTARQDEVAALIASAGDAVESSETTGVSVFVPWRDRERRTGDPVASVRTRVVLSGTDAVGDLLVALGSLDDVAVDGPAWGLRPDSPAYERARLAAVQDAVHRARQYAAAFGARLTALLEVADAGLSGGSEPFAAADAMAATGTAELLSAGPRLDLSPALQEVHGTVEVRFAMSAVDPERLAP